MQDFRYNPEMTPFEKYEKELRLRGVILRKGPGIWQIDHGGQRDEFEELYDAYQAGMAIEPPKPPRGVRRKRYLSMRPRARIRRAIKAHNRRLRFAGRGRMVFKQ